MHSGPQVPLGLVVFEGPMRVEQRAGVNVVMVSVCAESDTPVRLGPGSQTFRIGHARQEDYKSQEALFNGRLRRVVAKEDARTELVCSMLNVSADVCAKVGNTYK